VQGDNPSRTAQQKIDQEKASRRMHPDAAAVVRAIRESGRPSFENMAPHEARAAYLAARINNQKPPAEVAETADLSAPGDAASIPLRLYRGIGTAKDAALPCLLYMHGGGWLVGNLETHDVICRRLANASHACVVAVDYRLAPEHPFPAALRDAVAALRYIASEAVNLRIDAARLAVGGDSAGGNLAAVLALMGRDGDLPASVFQLLLYPVTDIARESESYASVAPGVPITAATMRYFVGCYAPNPADRAHWHASPINASLAGAPPALVLTCGHDPLCDEGQAYAAQLEQAGVRVTALHLNDQMHGFLMMDRLIGAASPVLDFAGTMLRDAWRASTSGPPL